MFRSNGRKSMLFISHRIDLISCYQHVVVTLSIPFEAEPHHSRGHFHCTCLCAPSPKIPPFGHQPPQPIFPFLLCSDREQQALEAIMIFSTYKGFQNPHFVTILMPLFKADALYKSTSKRDEGLDLYYCKPLFYLFRTVYFG